MRSQSIESRIVGERSFLCFKSTSVEDPRGVVHRVSGRTATTRRRNWSDYVIGQPSLSVHSVEEAVLRLSIPYGVQFRHSRCCLSDDAPLHPNRQHELYSVTIFGCTLRPS